MNQNVLLTIAASVGVVVGARGTWFATSTASKEVEVFSKEVKTRTVVEIVQLR
ncbi:hypothetical protein [Rhizobium giardinii]|uniref:Uncharacterized protein n=1 Tax=Rhizobium giardinii TaxID=56731 RepID=A0A7W8UBV5_9HYPH|nr:hypothetical protein [Rhizobium giardinii]MBB5535662.1 hypothetical protein [Rhizobium giardinii]